MSTTTVLDDLLADAHTAIEAVQKSVQDGEALNDDSVRLLGVLSREVQRLRNTAIYLAVSTGAPQVQVALWFDTTPARVNQIYKKELSTQPL